jgi:hypothetical protein
VDQVIVEASKNTEIVLISDLLTEQQNGEHKPGATAEFIANTFDVIGTVADAGAGVAELVSSSFDIGEIVAEAGWIALIMLPIVGIVWSAFRLTRAAQRWLEG